MKPIIARKVFNDGVIDREFGDGAIGGLLLGPEVLDDPALEDAGEWADADPDVTHNAVNGTITWSGTGDGGQAGTVDTPFTVGIKYEIRVVVDSISAGYVRLLNAQGAFQGTNTEWATAGTKVVQLVCTHDASLLFWGDATGNAVVSNASAKEIIS